MIVTWAVRSCRPCFKSTWCVDLSIEYTQHLHYKPSFKIHTKTALETIYLIAFQVLFSPNGADNLSEPQIYTDIKWNVTQTSAQQVGTVHQALTKSIKARCSLSLSASLSHSPNVFLPLCPGWQLISDRWIRAPDQVTWLYPWQPPGNP